MADLYTITLVSGTVLRWADFDGDVAHPVNGKTYTSSGPVLKRGNTRTVIGVEVDTLDLSIYPRATDLLDGVTLQAAARAGAFDGATVSLDRAFLSSTMTAIGTVNLFSGRFADTTVSRTEIQVRVNSGLESLNVNMPRNLYQAGCVHTLYDSGCALARESWAQSGTVTAGSTASVIACNLTKASGWFTRGYIRFDTGAQAGTTRTIKSYAPGQIALFLPLSAAPDVGDTFTVYAGCDKTQATCTSKFNNLPHFRATPYIPDPSTAA